MPLEERRAGMIFGTKVEVVMGPISLPVFFCGSPSIFGATTIKVVGSSCGASMNLSSSQTGRYGAYRIATEFSSALMRLESKVL